MKLKGILIVGLLLVQGALAQTLTLATSAQPETLDPQVTSATSSFQATKSLYDTLVEVNREGEIVPALAVSWEVSDDGLSWTFHLVDEVVFHDGTALDGEDVKATLERILTEETASPKAEEFRAITGIDVPDERTVVLTLSEPTPALLATLASGWGAVLPAEKIHADHDFGNDPVGTGPFQLTRWVRDSYLEFVRFDDYYQGPVQLEGVTLRFVQDSAVMLQGLLSGEFDVVSGVATPDIPTVSANPSLELVQEPSGTVLVAALNTRRPYLEDTRVRRALNYAVDEETVLEVAYGGGEAVGTFMEAGSPWYPASVQPFGYDPERARQLLAEAGVPSDWTLDLVLPQPYEAHIQAGQVLQDMLAEVGVASTIRVAEWGVWLGEVYGGPRDFDVTIIGHTGKLDPTGRLGGYGQAERTYTGFSNQRVAELLEKAASESDTERRRARYAEVLELLHEEPPFIYFGTSYSTYATRAAVEGFWITPLLDTFDFRSVRVN